MSKIVEIIQALVAKAQLLWDKVLDIIEAIKGLFS